MDGLCSWMVQQIKRATWEKFQLSGEKQPPVPYIFTTPQGLELDLRLFNRWVSVCLLLPSNYHWEKLNLIGEVQMLWTSFSDIILFIVHASGS